MQTQHNSISDKGGIIQKLIKNAGRNPEESQPNTVEYDAEKPRSNTIGHDTEYDVEETEAFITGYDAKETGAFITGHDVEETEAIITGQDAEETEGIITGRDAKKTEAIITGNDAEETEAIITGHDAEKIEAIITGQDSKETEPNATGHDSDEPKPNLIGNDFDKTELNLAECDAEIESNITVWRIQEQKAVKDEVEQYNGNFEDAIIQLTYNKNGNTDSTSDSDKQTSVSSYDSDDSDVDPNYEKSSSSASYSSTTSSDEEFGNIQAESNEDDIMSTDTESGLTQAGLEEYSRVYYDHHPIVFHHQKQSSYAQSEGYHSYVSSSDSSSTPFLDRLRQDSEVLLSRASQWSQETLQTIPSSISSSNTNLNNGNGNCNSEHNSSESTSSTETLKWHGSLSDVSVASHTTNSSAISGSASSQLIAHSSRVRTPKRHNSESVLYMADDQISVHSSQSGSTQDLMNKINSQRSRERSSRNNHRLFPVSTYTENSPTSPQSNGSPSSIGSGENGVGTKINSNWQSVAERISELERQHSSKSTTTNSQKYSYLDPSKTHRVSNPTLKAFQKNAVHSYFQRQQSFKENVNKIGSNSSLNGNGHHVPLRPQSLQLNNINSTKSSPRSSLPNNFGSNANLILTTPNSSTTPTKATNNYYARHSSSPQANMMNKNFHSHGTPSPDGLHVARPIKPESPTMHTGSNGTPSSPPTPPPRIRMALPTRRTSSASEYASSRDQATLRSKQNLSKDLLGPMIMGSVISVDDWVPERPPKNPMLRIPSPDPPPPPVTTVEADIQLLNQDEPLPPPPPEILRHMRQLSEPDSTKVSPSRRNSFAGSTNKKSLYRASTFENLSPPVLVPKPQNMQQTPPPVPPQTYHQVPQPQQQQQQQQHNNTNNTHVDGIVTPQMPRSNSSLGKHPLLPQKAHKVILNNSHKMEPLSPPATNPNLSNGSMMIPNRLNDSRLSFRKRTHNSQTPIELAPMKGIISPPPLKPKMSIFSSDLKPRNILSKSTTSYHPRHAYEKQHSQFSTEQGSYKMTGSPPAMAEKKKIDSPPIINESIVIQKSILPDVLPDGAKRTLDHDTPKSLSPVSPTIKHTTFQLQLNQSNNKLNELAARAAAHNAQTTQDYSSVMVDRDRDDSTKNEIDSKMKLFTRQMSQPADNPCNKIVIERKLSLDVNNSSKSDSDKNNNNSSGSSNEITTIEETNDRIDDSKTIEAPNEIEQTTKTDDAMIRERVVEEDLAKIDLGNDYANETNVDDLNASITITEISIPTNVVYKETDELKLVQKTEIVLRVNAPTSEAASQTDDNFIYSNGDINQGDGNGPEGSGNENCKNKLMPRQKLPEEIECDKLSKDLVSHLSPTDKLYNILAPPISKSSSDYVKDLYNPNISSRPMKRDVSTTTTIGSAPITTTTSTLEIIIPSRLKSNNFDCSNSLSMNAIESSSSSTVVASPSSQYFTIGATQTTMQTTIEGKTKIMSRYNREMTLINGDSCELMKKKEELLSRLCKKLLVLSNEQTTIGEEIIGNDLLGSTIVNKLAQKLKPNDASKLRSYIDDVGHITNLLLSLSSRLARIENTLHNLTEKATEKKILLTKRDRLLEQLDEAKRLKDDINRRGTLIIAILEKHLIADELSDYNYFINMKAKLLVDSKEIIDKIKLGEEQMLALKDTMVHSEC